MRKCTRQRDILPDGPNMRLIVREVLFPGDTMTLDTQLQDATRQAIDAARKIDKAKWVNGAAWADNPAIFTLARHLEAIAHDLDADDLEPYVLSFWGATNDPPDWDEAWEQWLDVWDHHKARLPVGNLAMIAAERARNKPDPDWARHYRPPVRFLIRVCVELARMLQDNGRFKLSQMDAAKILGCSQPSACRMLHRLCRDGVFLIVDKPPQGTERAIKYKLFRDCPN